MSVHHRKINPHDGFFSMSGDEVSILINNDKYIKFCIVRNPYSRLVSAWADKINQYEPGSIKNRKAIATHCNIEINDITFSHFVDWVTDTQDMSTCNVHWQPMVNLLNPNYVNYTHILRTESLSNDFSKLVDDIGFKEDSNSLLRKYRFNETLPLDWKELYNESIAKKVYENYKEDFQWLDYSGDSWMRENNNPLSYTELSIKYKKLEAAALSSIRSRNESIEYLVNKKPRVKAKQVLVLVIAIQNLLYLSWF